MAKNSVIKWRHEDEKNLKKAVSDFNKRVRKLQKTRKDTSYLPSEIDYEGTKELIKTRSELERVMRSLGRFKGREAFKKVELPSGEKLTLWEKKEIGYQKAQAVRRIKKRMAEIEKPYFKMGNEEYRKLEAQLRSIQNLYNKKGRAFEKTLKAIENLGSSDYEVRKALIYRENYLKMLEEYKNLPQYEALINILSKIQNPVAFYKKVSSLSEGEKIADITFMYDTWEIKHYLNNMLSELGAETEDYELNEGE